MKTINTGANVDSTIKNKETKKFKVWVLEGFDYYSNYRKIAMFGTKKDIVEYADRSMIRIRYLSKFMITNYYIVDKFVVVGNNYYRIVN